MAEWAKTEAGKAKLRRVQDRADRYCADQIKESVESAPAQGGNAAAPGVDDPVQTPPTFDFRPFMPEAVPSVPASASQPTLQPPPPVQPPAEGVPRAAGPEPDTPSRGLGPIPVDAELGAEPDEHEMEDDHMPEPAGPPEAHGEGMDVDAMMDERDLRRVIASMEKEQLSLIHI